MEANIKNIEQELKEHFRMTRRTLTLGDFRRELDSQVYIIDATSSKLAGLVDHLATNCVLSFINVRSELIRISGMAEKIFVSTNKEIVQHSANLAKLNEHSRVHANFISEITKSFVAGVEKMKIMCKSAFAEINGILNASNVADSKVQVSRLISNGVNWSNKLN